MKCCECGKSVFDLTISETSGDNKRMMYLQCIKCKNTIHYMVTVNPVKVSTNKPKVFCDECRFYHKYDYEYLEDHICEHPRGASTTWKSRNGPYEWTPFIKNKANNCPTYLPKRTNLKFRYIKFLIKKIKRVWR